MEQPVTMDVDVISTHSLTRRLTSLPGKVWSILQHFNSQPHKEADEDFEDEDEEETISTHSLTRRLTIKKPQNRRALKHFNSQPHKEADESPTQVLQLPQHFNSQPHKEADVGCFIFQKVL